MTLYRVSTDYGEKETRAESEAKARANVAYRLRCGGCFLPRGRHRFWAVSVVVVPPVKAPAPAVARVA